MLTLKSPIQLNTTRGFTSTSDAFCQRLMGNYNLLGASYSPKDLLFLLSAPPNLPQEQGSMTTIAVENSTTNFNTYLKEYQYLNCLFMLLNNWLHESTLMILNH